MLKTTIKKFDTNILDKILQEVVLLRHELKFVLPQDDLNNYKNSNKIKKSYQDAVKEYSPLCE